jgi:replicative DNA helicase
MAACATQVPFENITRANMTNNELKALIDEQAGMANIPIWIDDRGGISITQLKARAKSECRKHSIGLIIIDYLQLMRGVKGNKSGNREQEISEVSRELKALAKELELPIIALAQLNRNVEGRKHPKPMPADLRESGSIEQDADLIGFIYHEEDGNTNRKKNMISLAKHRNGATDDIEVVFIPYLQKWTDKNSFPMQQEQGHFNPFIGIPKTTGGITEDLSW